MDQRDFDKTISDSPEESLKKAIELMSGGQQREITRPDIKAFSMISKFFAYLLAVSILCIAAFWVSEKIGINIAFPIIFSVALAFTVVSVNSKRLIISAVLLYQRFAPKKMRASCLFTPSCSEYMLQAVEKYGVIKGVGKGIKRIRRCHPPNGGIDLP